MDRLVTRLHGIRSLAGRNREDIDSLISDVEGLNVGSSSTSSVNATSTSAAARVGNRRGGGGGGDGDSSQQQRRQQAAQPPPWPRGSGEGGGADPQFSGMTSSFSSPSMEYWSQGSTASGTTRRQPRGNATATEKPVEDTYNDALIAALLADELNDDDEDEDYDMNDRDSSVFYDASQSPELTTTRAAAAAAQQNHAATRSEMSGALVLPRFGSGVNEDEDEYDERLETAIAIALVDSLDEISHAAAATSSHLNTQEARSSMNSSWINPLRDIAAGTSSSSGPATTAAAGKRRAVISEIQVPTCPICTDAFTVPTGPPPTNATIDSSSTGGGHSRTVFEEQDGFLYFWDLPADEKQRAPPLQEGEESSSSSTQSEKVFCPACIQPYHATCLAPWLRMESASRRCPQCREVFEGEFVEEVCALADGVS